MANRHRFSVVEGKVSKNNSTPSRVHHFMMGIQIAEGNEVRIFINVFIKHFERNWWNVIILHFHNQLELELWDTTVMEDFDRLSPLTYTNIDVILL